MNERILEQTFFEFHSSRYRDHAGILLSQIWKASSVRRVLLQVASQ